MSSRHDTVLCRYHYDPLDQITSVSPKTTTESQRFYCKSRIATEIEGLMSRSIFQHDDQLLSQQNKQDSVVTSVLLGTDQQRSVLNTVSTNESGLIAYSPYGHRAISSGLLSLLAFNGERRDPVTGYYILGNGYRAFNPTLMRFISPDSWSPFGKGGLNAYAYCEGNPVTKVDPTGHGVVSDLLSALSKPSYPSKNLQKAINRTAGKLGGEFHVTTRASTAAQQNELIMKTISRSMEKIEANLKILNNLENPPGTLPKSRTIEQVRKKMLKHNAIIGEIKYSGGDIIGDRAVGYINGMQDKIGLSLRGQNIPAFESQTALNLQVRSS